MVYLVYLLCAARRSPADINTTLLGRALTALAWLSSKKEAAAACSRPRVVSALLDVLRLERQAYQALHALAKERYQQQLQQQEQQQQVVQLQPPKPAAPAWQYSSTILSKPVAGASALADEAAAPPPLKQLEDQEVPALPQCVLRAPFTALQQPDTWLLDWLQQQQPVCHSPCSPHSLARSASGWKSGAGSRGPSSPGREQLTPAAAAALPFGSRVSSPGRSCAGAGTAAAAGAGSPVTCRSSCSRPGMSPGRACSSSRTWEADDPEEPVTVRSELAAAEMSTPDGCEGMLAVWALLNISTRHEGKVVICRKGLYTLLRLVQQSSGQRSIAAGPDEQRASVVAAVLENLTAATENTAMVYKAELRLKHAALLKQAGIKRVHRERHQRTLSRPGSPSPPVAAGAAVASGAALASKQQQQQQTLANPGSQAMPPPAGSAASAIMGFFEGGSSSNSPGRTSRLTVAANTACMVANMCTSARGPPKKLSHEDEKVSFCCLCTTSASFLRSSKGLLYYAADYICWLRNAAAIQCYMHTALNDMVAQLCSC